MAIKRPIVLLIKQQFLDLLDCGAAIALALIKLDQQASQPQLSRFQRQALAREMCGHPHIIDALVVFRELRVDCRRGRIEVGRRAQRDDRSEVILLSFEYLGLDKILHRLTMPLVGGLIRLAQRPSAGATARGEQ